MKRAKGKIAHHIEYYGKRKTKARYLFAPFNWARIEPCVKMIKCEMGLKKRSLRILDVGCSEGTVSKLFLDLGNDVYGIDIIPELIKKAKQKGVKARVWDCEKGLPFPNNYFDAVYAAELIEHIYDTEHLLKEARRVLKKNGVLILTTPNIASLTSRIRLLFGLYPKFVAPALKHWQPGGHIRTFTKDVLEMLLKRNGFEVEKVISNLLSFVPTKRTSEPWSVALGRMFPTLGEILIVKARKK